MGMVLVLATLSDRNVERVLADPALVARAIAPDDPGYYRSLKGPPPTGCLPSLLLGGGRAEAEAVPDLEAGPGELVSTDLDKAWHGLHFLFTGTAWEGDPPLDFLVKGGTQAGTLEVGYGPARLYRAAETRTLAEALARLPDDELRSRFDPARMTELDIYPSAIWTRDPDEDDSLGYLMEFLGSLREFLAAAVGHGLGMVVVLS